MAAAGALNREISSIIPILMTTIVLTAVVIALVLFFLKKKASEIQLDEDDGSDPENSILSKLPAQGALPEQKSEGKRVLDSLVLTDEHQKKHAEAKTLLRRGKIKDAVSMLESLGMQREAINILESAGSYDEAAAILLRMNRPNRAAALYERNKKFDYAAIYFLKARLLDDAKRCCKQIPEFSLSLSVQLAELFAEAGDIKSSIRLLAKINDRARLLRVVRTKSAFRELFEFLDIGAARGFILSSLDSSDLSRMLSTSEDSGDAAGRALVLINESGRTEWITLVVSYIGDKRGAIGQFCAQILPEHLRGYRDHISGLTPQQIQNQRKALEWTARAMHDLMEMHTAATIFEKLGMRTLAGKCWAIKGETPRALDIFKASDTDAAFVETYLAELGRLGISAEISRELDEHERENLARFFAGIDPDTENSRLESPFSIAS